MHQPQNEKVRGKKRQSGLEIKSKGVDDIHSFYDVDYCRLHIESRESQGSIGNKKLIINHLQQSFSSLQSSEIHNVEDFMQTT